MSPLLSILCSTNLDFFVLSLLSKDPFHTHNGEAFVRRCSVEKVFLEISQNSQENTCARVSFTRPATLLKKRLWHRCFPVNFAKFLRTPLFTKHLRRLLLIMLVYTCKRENQSFELISWHLGKKNSIYW